MSSNYSAGQFNDAFSPKRLGNWGVSNANYEQRPGLSFTTGISPGFIANERGHLLPGVPRNKGTSHWGGLNEYTGDNILCPCSSTRLYKNPSELKSSLTNKRYPIPCFFKKKILDVNVQRPPAARKLIDPYLNYLRDLELPVVWIVGQPSRSILQFHKGFAHQLAKELNYSSINLDDYILKWLNRQNESPQTRKGILKFLNKPEASRLQRKNTAPNNRKTKRIVQTRKQEDENDLGPKIKFDTSLPFDTDKLIELLKFAMIECLPSKGFVISGFPCNMEEAGEFEKQFYPPAVGLHITSTAHSQDVQVTQRNRPSKKVKVCPENDPIEKPSQFKRTYTYSSGEINNIGNNYGHKIIRVMDADVFEQDKDMVNYVYEHVKRRIQIYLDILSGKILAGTELESSCVSSTATSSGVNFSSTPTEYYQRSTADDPFINLPPPLISCSGSSVSFPIGTPKSHRVNFKCSKNPTPCSPGPWKEQLESIRSNIQSWVPSWPREKENAHKVEWKVEGNLAIESSVSQLSPDIKWEDPDERPLPVSNLSLSIVSIEDITKFSTAEDPGAIGDRPIAIEPLEADPIIQQRLIEELDDWFESTSVKGPAIKTEEPTENFNLDLEEGHEKCDGDHACKNMKAED